MDQAHVHIGVTEGPAEMEGEALPAPLRTPAANDLAALVVGPGTVHRDRLINKLNYLNFQNRTVLLAFQHAKYGHTLRLEAWPQACRDHHLPCTWVDPRAARGISKHYVLASFFVPDEQKLLRGVAKVAHVDEEGIVIELPEICTEVHSRRVVRHPCRGIQAELLSSGCRFQGELVDFSPLSFRARVHATPPQTFGWLSRSLPIMVVLSSAGGVLYSGECRIVSLTGGQRVREYVLAPTQECIQRFERKQYRSPRHALVPEPTVVFEHPLTGRLLSLKVLDLASSGLAVEEDAGNATLMPGLMIPRLKLCLAGSLSFACRAQVVHRQTMAGELDGRRLKCGLAILDMDVADHVHLVGLLHQAGDRRSYVCNQVDMDELWSFFFETGFIYPQKYGFIQNNRDGIKRTYETLYGRSPAIARHFIYQDGGKILGHMAMVRFCDNTWLIHHHAARTSYTFKAGLNVLEQIGRFITDSCRFAFMHMEHVICFYRPENRFPRRIFGGACRSIADRHLCSEDVFAYFHHRCDQTQRDRSPDTYSVGLADDDDLRELSNFYRYQSGGLTLRALGLEPGEADEGDLSKEFAKLGLRRERHVHALRCQDRLQAIALVNVADVGLNLSDLTNCIAFFVLDRDDTVVAGIHHAVSVLGKSLGQELVPVLMYPEAAAEDLQIPVEKRYVLWSLVPHSSDGFHRYTNAILRAGRRNGATHDKRRSPPV